MVLLSEVQRLATVTSTVGSGMVRCPILLSGDFNSQPFSPLYHLLVSGRLTYANLTAQTIDGEHEVDERSCLRSRTLSACANSPSRFLPAHLGISNRCRWESHYYGSAHTVQHTLRLMSSYTHEQKGCREFSTRHRMSCCTVDYILYSSDTPCQNWTNPEVDVPYFRALRLLSLPATACLGRCAEECRPA